VLQVLFSPLSALWAPFPMNETRGIQNIYYHRPSHNGGLETGSFCIDRGQDVQKASIAGRRPEGEDYLYYLCSHPCIRKYLKKNRMLYPAVYNVGFFHPVFNRLNTAVDFRNHPPLNLPGFDMTGNIIRIYG